MKIKATVFGLILMISFAGIAQTKLHYIASGDAITNGKKYLKKEEYKSALKYFKKVHVGDTNYYWAQYQLATTYFEMSDFEKSVEISAEGIKEDSYYLNDFYGLLGSSYEKQKKYDLALKTYAKGLEIFPRYYDLYYRRAMTYEQMENWQEMANDLQNTVKYNPFYTKPHLKLAEMAREEGQYTKAMLCYNSYLLLSASKSLEELTDYNEFLKGDYSSEPRGIKLSEEDFSEIDELIAAQIAMDKKYKVPNKISLPVVKQNYLLFQELQKMELGTGFWGKYYAPFFIKVMEDDKFNDYIYYALQSSTNNSIVNILNKNIKLIKAFPDYAGKAWQETHSDNYEMFNGEMTSVHYYWKNSSAISGVGVVIDNEPVGEFHYYYSTGRLSAIGNYDTDGERKGSWTYFHENGVKSGSEIYEDGDMEGNDSSFYDNGVLKSVIFYVNGKSEGKGYLYEKTGIPSDIVTYKLGELSGSATYYNGVGGLHYNVNYLANELNGNFKEFYDNGQIAQDVNFVDGKRDGLAITHYKNGQKSAELNYAHGEFDGSVTRWYKDGTLKLEGNYKEGSNIGTLKEYNLNGTLASEKTFDNNGKETGEYMEYDKSGNLNMVLVYKKGDLVAYRIYHRNGSLIKEAKKKGGEFFFENFYSDGTKKAEGLYLTGDLGKSGTWKFYNENGVLDSESTYDNGKLTGKGYDYYSTGKKYTTTSYKDGKQNGLYVKYYASGQVYKQGYYVDDELEGVWMEYYPNGTVSEELFYVNGKLNGPQKYFTVNGKIDEIDMYDNGNNTQFDIFDTNEISIQVVNITPDSLVLSPHYPIGDKIRDFTKKGYIVHGPSINYFPNGKVDRKGNYWDGNKNGEWVSYYPNNQLKSRGNYFYGRKQGDWIYYYDNGKVKLEETYLNGKKHGIRFWYHENGKLDQKRPYEHGKVNGKGYFYDGNGVLQQVREYFYGKVVGYTYPDTDGELKEMIPITNETCDCKSYFPNGNVSREYHMTNGNFNGDYIEYYENGKVFTKTKYENDQKVKTKYTYWDNGKVMIEQPYKLGEEHGVVKHFNKDGSLLKTVTYHYGTLHGPTQLYKMGKVVKTLTYYDGSLISK